ncbi:hypothetical protein MLD38_037179 [Melastoma candidum]|uniref:Uncharacterized protein n=1 Tax=Melastoma candidum TaxID=119954 RepID=A0ACB9LLB2_9MYRT|nr:hypothetical protein MLD38_037179 [Melastoma candidum]
MTLIAGSYEKFIWGFSLSSSSPSDESLTLNLKRLFTYPSHLSPITAVAAASPLAASSSSGDSSVHLYHLPSSASLGSIPVPHPSTCLAFYSSGHLISGSSDGNVSIFDTDPFVLLKSIPMGRGKSGGLCVNDVAVHGSGRLALVVGRGRKKGGGWLGMVNLVRGRKSYVGGGLGGEGRLVGWAGEGGFYSVVGDGKLGWHAAEDARGIWEVECDKRILCTEAATLSGIIYTGGEDRSITAWDINSGKAAFTIDGAHSSRVKGIVILNENAEASGDNALPYLVSSASSDGVIRIWDVRAAMKERPNPLAEVNTKSRITCLAGTSFKTLKRKWAGVKNLQEDNLSLHEES